eukprot:gene37417-45143_t
MGEWGRLFARCAKRVTEESTMNDVRDKRVTEESMSNDAKDERVTEESTRNDAKDERDEQLEDALQENPLRRLLLALLRDLNLVHFADLLFDAGIDGPVDIIGVDWHGLVALGISKADARLIA